MSYTNLKHKAAVKCQRYLYSKLHLRFSPSTLPCSELLSDTTHFAVTVMFPANLQTTTKTSHLVILDSNSKR